MIHNHPNTAIIAHFYLLTKKEVLSFSKLKSRFSGVFFSCDARNASDARDADDAGTKQGL